MKTWGKYFFNTCLSSLLIISSCKNPDNVGLDVIPASDHLYTLFTDTITIVSKTVREDSLRSDEVSKMLIGSMDDADFGYSSASLYTQVLLGLTPHLATNGGTLTTDSLILSFAYNGHYGDTLTPLTIHAYRLSDDMYLDSSYYTNKTFNEDTTIDLANSYQFIPQPTTSVLVGTTTLVPQLRIRLSNQYLGDSLVMFDGQAPYTDNTSWISHFKGLYLKVDSITSTNHGSVLYFNPSDANTKMTLYYHEDTVAKSYDYTLVGAARVNHQQHDFSGSSAGMQLQDSSYHDSLTYIQAMAGLKANLSFPYLSNLISSGKIVINKAELVITVGSFQDTATFPVTGTLLLLAYDENGGLTYLTDFLDQGITFGGIYGIPTPHTYKFNIGRHLQRILDGNLANNGFSLNIISSVVQADRAVIGSGKSLGGNTAKMKLNLYYTKL